MGHIANLILDSSVGVGASENLPSATPSPNNNTSVTQKSVLSSVNNPEFMTETHVWRMYQTSKNKSPLNQQHKVEDKQVTSKEGLKPDEITTNSSSPNIFHSRLLSLDKAWPSLTLSTALKKKLKEPIQNRRRKISVPDIGPMTTVQELAMDSPTIPGRPPIHERSRSVPVSKSRQKLGESTVTFLSGPVPDENAEIAEEETEISDLKTHTMKEKPEKADENPQTTQEMPEIADLQTSDTGNQEELLQTPTESVPFKLTLKISPPSESIFTNPINDIDQNNLQSYHPLKSQKSSKVISPEMYQSPEVPPKQLKARQESPLSAPKSLPFIPISSWSSAFSVSTPTSVSSPEGRSSPKPRSFGRSSPNAWSIGGRSSPKSSPTSSLSSLRLKSQKSETSLISEASKMSSKRGHGRHNSEDDAALKSNDRGRSQQRSNLTTISKENTTIGSPDPTSTLPLNERNSDPKNSTCSLPEIQCFLNLPTGHPPSSVSGNLSPTELTYLQNQALSQAFRFEVLCSRDVASLSRELRALDERCEYLRKTHLSLRNDRQLQHARMFSSLRKTCMGRVSYDVLSKFEANLSELGRCIDACVSKFELAENRRLRVRQKLLEHVAAAAVVEIRSPPKDSHLQSNNYISLDTTGENTPPRSPQHCPERTELENKGIPLHLESIDLPVPEPLLSHTSRIHESISEGTNEKSLEESENFPLNQDSDLASLAQPLQDSYFYTDKNVFDLMDCVEEEMERMGM